MRFTVDQIAAVLGLPAPNNKPVEGWSIDTRTLTPGDLFFALRGPVHDGNDFIDQALLKGAVAVIAEKWSPHPEFLAPVLVVPDALAALHQVASWARTQWPGEVIGITGSAGKTSTKEVAADLLATRFRVGRTIGNFNNHVGLPVSILRLPQDAQVAVLEMGMNHAGEIRKLAAIARPRIGVVTMTGSAHIEFFDSLEGVASAKRELIESLPPDGIAVLNADDARVVRFAEAHAGRTITFGLEEHAEMRAEDVQFSAGLTRFQVRGVQFETALQGRHGVRNILAGLAVANVYGIELSQLKDAVRALQPPKMRGERMQFRGIDIFDDCYNSSPDAAKAMLDVLRDTPAKRRVAVLGEMLELGRWSEMLHRDVGKYAAENGIDVLVGIRGAARVMADAAIQAGLPANAAYFFDEPVEAGARLLEIARPGDAILFKGSRATGVESALERFLAG